MKKFTTLLLSGALICAQAFAVSAEGNNWENPTMAFKGVRIS